MTHQTDMTISTREQYQAEKSRLREAASAYYTDGTSVMTDADYDILAREIERVENEHPDWTDGDAASTQVAGGADVAGDVEHSIPMMSLDNVFSADEFRAWGKQLAKRVVATDAPPFMVEPKMDGLAMCLRYADGELVQMVTRGDGTHGEDVSYAIKALSNVPKSKVCFYGPSIKGPVSTRDLVPTPFTGEVRGEVIFSREQFEAANDLRSANKDKLFVNARNGAAGALRGARDRDYVIPLSFLAYDVADWSTVEDGVDQHRVLIDALERLGFTTARSVLEKLVGVEGDSLNPVRNPMRVDKVIKVIEQVEDRREEIDFEIDGIVVKANFASDRSKAGSGSKAPYWAIAYKYPAAEVMSTLTDILWQVGRTGVITPRAVIEPVFVGGTTITYATLHNPDDIKRKGFLMGDKVLVKRAGEVIPRLEAPVVALRDGSQTEIVPPTSCPRCGGAIDTSQSRWRCIKGRNCGLVESIAYAVGRDALDIEGLGKTQVSNLVESDTFTDVASIFEDGMDEAKLVSGGKVAPANAPKIVAQVEKAKGAGLARVITALGIRGTGRSMSRRLAKHFGSMDALRAASVEELAGVDKIGEVKAALIVEELAELSNVIDRLVAAGVSMTDVAPAVVVGADGSAPTAGAQPLEGMSVCVTGTMVTKTRNEMNELVEALGGRAASSVSKSTNILVAGPGAGSKLAKAESLGVKVMTEDEFLAEYVK